MIKALSNIYWNPDTATGTATVTADFKQVSGTGNVVSRILVAEGLFGWSDYYIQAALPAGASVSALFSASDDCIKWSAWADMEGLPALRFVKIKLTLTDATLSWMKLFYADRALPAPGSIGDRMISELPPGLMYNKYGQGNICAGELKALGNILDKNEALILEIQDQFFPQRATWGLSAWEESLGLAVKPPYDLKTRRNIVLAKIRSQRGISRQIFENVLSTLGYTATIHEYYTEVFRAGKSRAGDRLYPPSAAVCWSVIISNSTPLVKVFRAGQSRAGDALYAYDDFGEIETLFQKMKPSHTWVGFLYQ